jgi:3-oxoacyl-[acyl-carrier protein] reductase
VRVNAIAPGYVRTRLTGVLADERRERLLAATALGRLGEPEDVAGPVAFLCSPAAAFITGAVLTVDGGLRL